MSRIPPVVIEHIDVSAFFQEVSALRAEVRSLAAVRFLTFGTQCCVCRMPRRLLPLLSVIPNAIKDRALPAIYLQSVSNTLVDDPADDAVAADQHFNDVALDDVGVKEGVSSFSQVARKLKPTGMTEKTLSMNTLKPIVGVSMGNSQIKSVGRKRSVDVFVTRLDLETDCSEVKSCVSDMLNISYDNIICNS